MGSSLKFKNLFKICLEMKHWIYSTLLLVVLSFLCERSVMLEKSVLFSELNYNNKN